MPPALLNWNWQRVLKVALAPSVMAAARGRR